MASSRTPASPTTSPELVLSRAFDAPRALVWEAWTRPEHLARWWGPNGFTLPTCQVDLRAGGAYRFCMRGPDGTEHWFGGTYREVAPPERLVFTAVLDDDPGHEMVTAITLSELDGGRRTQLTLRQTPPRNPEYARGQEQGWSESLVRLDVLLARVGRTPRIAPCLWFDGQAEEAARFYTSLFPDAWIGRVSRYGEAGPGTPGSVMVVEFFLDGQPFQALNGGPQFEFTPAISLCVSCETQAELDALHDRLVEGGERQPCGWVLDRFGVSWQLVPASLPAMLVDPDPARVKRVMDAVLQMQKPDVGALERAYGPA